MLYPAFENAIEMPIGEGFGLEDIDYAKLKIAELK